MIAIASLLLVIALSFLIVRVGAIALSMTGLSDEVAWFQALSAFSGAGFTTGENENMVNGPTRRRVVARLIRAGSAGVVTAISTLMLSMLGDRFATSSKLVVLVLGVAVIIAVARSSRLDALTRPLIERALRRSATLKLRDHAGPLYLREDRRVAELDVEPDSWPAGRTLSKLRTRDEGVTVLGVEHADGAYLGTPDGGRGAGAGRPRGALRLPQPPWRALGPPRGGPPGACAGQSGRPGPTRPGRRHPMAGTGRRHGVGRSRDRAPAIRDRQPVRPSGRSGRAVPHPARVTVVGRRPRTVAATGGSFLRPTTGAGGHKSVVAGWDRPTPSAARMSARRACSRTVPGASSHRPGAPLRGLAGRDLGRTPRPHGILAGLCAMASVAPLAMAQG